jgi:hypothetical protein
MTPRSEPQASVGNGETWGRAIGQAAGFESRIDISADVIRVRKVSSVKGWLRDGAGMDRPIPTDERFCTDGSGCVCPDGKKLGYTEIQPGDARIGYADTAQPGSVVITGESLDEHCKVQPVGALTVRGGQGLAILATFKSGTCSVTKGQFQAKAKDGGWSIVVHIPHFAGYGQVYPLRVGSSAEFVITGPGGPYSNANPPPNHGPAGGEIRFYPNGSKMSLGFEYAWNPSARNGVLPIGAMTCKRPKR